MAVTPEFRYPGSIIDVKRHNDLILDRLERSYETD